jgi:hypothetical protein
MPRTIRLKGYGQRIEKPAAGAITPGALLLLGSGNTFTINATAAVARAPIFALENELIGKGIDDNYASGDLVQAEHFHKGDWVLAFVAASATAIVIGDQLEADAAGGLRKFASGIPLAVAMEAVDNSAGGAIARIKVAIL